MTKTGGGVVVSLQTFNIVMVVDNIPVPQIPLTDFTFNHRALKETMRLPITAAGEARGVTLQLLPDRIEATVTSTLDAVTDAGRLASMLETVFDYIGPKSVKAVGHNAQFTIDGTESHKISSIRSLVNVDAASALLGGVVANADVHLYTTTPEGGKLRMSVLSETTRDELVLDFNINFDLPGPLGARDAVGNLAKSLAYIQTIAQRAATTLTGAGVR